MTVKPLILNPPPSINLSFCIPTTKTISSIPKNSRILPGYAKQLWGALKMARPPWFYWNTFLFNLNPGSSLFEKALDDVNKQFVIYKLLKN